MGQNPLDTVPAHNRVSFRAVVLQPNQDAAAALAAAGILDPVGIPIAATDSPGEAIGLLGAGTIPHLAAVLETQGTEIATPPPQADAPDPSADAANPPPSGSAMLEAAFGGQPLAPVRKRRR